MAPERTSAGRHDWVVLDSEEAHAQVVGDFVAEGVRRGEQVLLVGLGAREERMWTRLSRQGLLGPGHPGATSAQALDRPVRILPPDPDAVRAAITGAVAEGWPGVRFSGALTSAGGNPFEAVVTELVAHLPLTVLCPYFRDLLVPGQREQLTQLHDHEHDAGAEYDDGVFRLVVAGTVLRMAGELDSANADALRAVLGATLQVSARPATWDVTDLRFLDVGAADALVAAAAGPPGLTLVGASRLTGRLITLMAGRHPGREVRLADGGGAGR
ncbi:MEDS domain-containing protein [Geodermatophilus sp. SYSU D00766]